LTTTEAIYYAVGHLLPPALLLLNLLPFFVEQNRSIAEKYKQDAWWLALDKYEHRVVFAGNIHKYEHKRKVGGWGLVV